MPEQNNILIVGAGPVGLTLGCLLQQTGISCQIIDKSQTRSTLTRAVGVSASTLEILDHLGIYEKFLQQSVSTDAIHFYWGRKKLMRLLPNSLQKSASKFVYTKQPILEHLLEACFQEQGGVIAWDTELLDIKHEGNLLNTEVNSKTCKHQSSYRYIVGCDGSQSKVQKILNPQLQRGEYGAYFVLADVETKNLTMDRAHYFINPEGYLIIIPLPQQSLRIIFSFKNRYQANCHEQYDATHLEKIIWERSGKHLDIKKILWRTSAPFRYQIALEPSRAGVILAGDALHLFSPIGGTNMNFGIQDSIEIYKSFQRISNGDDPDLVWNFYNKNRLEAMLKNLQITSEATLLITQSEGRDNLLEKSFLPMFTNRKFARSYAQNFSLL